MTRHLRTLAPLPTTRRARLTAGALIAGLTVGTGAIALQHDTPAVDEVRAGSQAAPSPLALAPQPAAVKPVPKRASRGTARTALPAQVPMKTVTKTIATGSTFSGQASWYGGYFQGRTTANGERFDTNDLTAASKTLPFGTRLRVCRLDNCVVVRINDRGPYVGNRVLDLSRAAAQQLGYDGVASVTATPVATRTVTVPDEQALRARAVKEQRAAAARRVQAARVALTAQQARTAAQQRAAEAAAQQQVQQRQEQALLAAQEQDLAVDPTLVLLGAGLAAAAGGGVLRLRRRRTGGAS